MPSVGSVHSAAAMPNFSVRGTGKKFPDNAAIMKHASTKKITFVQAFRELMSEAYKCKDKGV